ncbi:MAG: phosphoglycerate kinase [Legionellales bacterium]|nr:phosphoglycerate kinase [Legionellales bacterium]
MNFSSIDQYNLTNKKVIVREDFNVPIVNGDITDLTRIEVALPTIKSLISKKAKIGIISHLGRPKNNTFEQELSLAPVCNVLAKLLEHPVKLISNDFSEPLSSEYISIFENIRFLEGETTNDEQLAKKMASFCDFFVMDAFGCSHRAHASTNGIAKFSPISVAGPLLIKEISSIKNAISSPKKPVLAIVGGAKISSKLPLLTELIKYVDKLIIGGGMANTCLKAQELEIGKSLYESTIVATAKTLLDTNKEKIILPVDAVVAKNLHEPDNTRITSFDQMQPDDIIGDIGPNTIELYRETILEAKTIIWNGPVGIFEIDTFQNGTKNLAIDIANSKSYSIAGGGDTISSINKFDVTQKISYISTGGGAFLCLLQNKELPGVTYLAKSDQSPT